MTKRASVAVVLAAILVGCQSEFPTRSSELNGSAGTARRAVVPSTAATGTCPACTFEPVVYTRQTATPITEVVEFLGNPAGAYIIEIDDLGSRGAEARVELNGKPLNVQSGYLRQAVVLNWQNKLESRLTGKPASQLSVRVFQEVTSVTVTPGTPRSRIPTTLQFVAVAKDKNGVVIPRQTFTWESRSLPIATIGAATGLGATTGPVVNMAPWNYKTTSTGEGMVDIVANADGTAGMSGTAKWTVVSGFIYITYQAALPIASPNRASRPASVPYRYDVPRLQSMAATCATESHNTAWRERPVVSGERQFKQCYPVLETETPTRVWVPPTALTDGFYIYGSDNNVGLYGRYCGAGQPDGEWWTRAHQPGYQPKDPIDALCSEHDRSEDLHELNATTNAAAAACIVRYGIESEGLYEEGVRIASGSARWNAFWSAWPEMAAARAHWLNEAGKVCFGPIYNNFLSDRGLTV